jgi:CheY-like chemotaxis protein
MGSKKILIVDDEKDRLLVLEKQLTTAGYKAKRPECNSIAVTSRRPLPC